MESAFDRREEEFRDRDAFTFALLGVISFAKRLERTLTKLAPAPAASNFDDRQVDLLLGFISLSRKALKELQAWRDSAVPSRPEVARASTVRRSEFMR